MTATSPEMRIMVSYQNAAYPNDCGNQTFDTIEEADIYIGENQHKWKSHSLFNYEAGRAITDLLPYPSVWTLFEKTASYFYWRRNDNGQMIYNCTKENAPPPESNGGYPNLKALKQLKSDN